MNINKLYKEFREVLHTLPEWNEFRFSFEKKADNNKISIEKAREEINNNLRNRINGIYWIIDKDDKTLYIGKGKSINDRLISHYKSYLGIDRNNAWIDFFSNIKGEIRIKWIEIDDENQYLGETLRIIVERLLTNEKMLQTNDKEPLFEVNHRSIK